MQQEDLEVWHSLPEATPDKERPNPPTARHRPREATKGRGRPVPRAITRTVAEVARLIITAIHHSHLHCTFLIRNNCPVKCRSIYRPHNLTGRSLHFKDIQMIFINN